MRILKNAKVVSNGGITDDSWVAVDGGIIEAVGTGPREDGEDLHSMYLLPGLVDIHLHGALGCRFSDGTKKEVLTAAMYHLERGSTFFLAGLSAAPLEDMVRTSHFVQNIGAANGLGGVFWEGPFLSARRAGAQNLSALVDPGVVTDSFIETLLSNGIRMITIAPELSGAGHLIRLARDAGIVVAAGHTDADYDQMHSAFQNGVSVVTHLFNAMADLDHRRPTAALAALNCPDITCEVIGDGVHLNSRLVEFLFKSLGPHRIALVTDATEAAGMPDGQHLRNGVPITVREGSVTLSDGTLAGGVRALSENLRYVVRHCGVSLADAVTAASATPAQVLNLESTIGSVQPGKRADLLVMDESLCVTRVMFGGSWIEPHTR